MISIDKEAPLVSIVVVTYNSAEFVIETLESCKVQTYQNIELIITDDGSADDTVSICKKWVSENKSRFSNAEVVTVVKNTGISANCNRGVSSANGEWIKTIAGDDALMPDCIKDNLAYINENPDAQVIHSKRHDYQGDFQEQNFIEEYTVEHHPFGSSHITASKQFEILLRQVYVSAPTIFIKKSLLIEMKGFDESIPMIEDWPLWLRITSAGYKIHYLNKATIKYRLHAASVSSTQHQTRLISKLEERKHIVYKNYIYPNVPAFERLLYEYNFKRMKAFNYFGINKRTKFTWFLDKLTAYPVFKYRLLKDRRIVASLKKSK
ncbi:glycosyltransferase [Flammeovirgaceae bacterium 311]|nr:glycosyltransferase [Flammeovirgaceae bacterium 311]